MWSAYLIVLSVLTVHSRGGGNYAAEHLTRGDLQKFIGDKSNPSFWPVRGRRETKRAPEYRRIVRKPKEEETGVFWAGRGRSYGGNDVVDEDKFWANRGRSENWPEEEAEDVICSGAGKTIRAEKQGFIPKICYLKRKAGNVLRELPQQEQFWPLRGKKLVPWRKRQDESWKENFRDLKTFWPAGGRRTYPPGTANLTHIR